MFAIFSSYAIYNDRDGIAGRRIERVSEYVYETEALAHKMKPSEYDDEGQSMEVDYYVARTSNPFNRLRRAVADDGSDDIPF